MFSLAVSIMGYK